MEEHFQNMCSSFGIDSNYFSSFQEHNRILDCPSGASSFVAEVDKLGIKVVGCDPLFDVSLERIKKRGKEDIDHVIEKVKLASHLYKWDFYKSIEGLREYRNLALKRFISDYYDGILENRYIKAALPKLPFDDKSFDLVLSGHFLFTYADKFDFDFHLSSILELFRVSSMEVRIYPLQQGMISQPYKQMPKLLSSLEKLSIEYEIIAVPFEFQKGSNKMLRLMH